jgi:hypothetical protein
MIAVPPMARSGTPAAPSVAIIYAASALGALVMAVMLSYAIMRRD